MTEKNQDDCSHNKRNRTTRLAKMLDALEKTQVEFAKTTGFSAEYINRVKNGSEKISNSLIEATTKHYGLRYGEYLCGLSNVIEDDATHILKHIHRIFSEIGVTTQKYMNGKREEVENKFLTISMDECLYKLLMDKDHLDFRKENNDIGVKDYDTELGSAKKNYLKRKGKGRKPQYVLIPVEEMPFIVATDRQHKIQWGEVQKVLDWDYQVNSSPDNMLKLARLLDEDSSATQSREEY